MVHRFESVIFFGVGPVLWASGLLLFAVSPLSRRRKVVWASVLITVGAVIGFVLTPSAIRENFAILLVLLPVLALIDVKLMSSDRGFVFWVRACGFEICTVFAAAAVCRYWLELLALRR